jgi:hypothetical protein
MPTSTDGPDRHTDADSEYHPPLIAVKLAGLKRATAGYVNDPLASSPCLM